jgi:hypothetical protein
MEIDRKQVAWQSTRGMAIDLLIDDDRKNVEEKRSEVDAGRDDDDPDPEGGVAEGGVAWGHRYNVFLVASATVRQTMLRNNITH